MEGIFFSLCVSGCQRVHSSSESLLDVPNLQAALGRPMCCGQHFLLRTKPPGLASRGPPPGTCLRKIATDSAFQCISGTSAVPLKGVRMPRTRLWTPATCFSQRWGHLAEAPGCLPGLPSLLGFSSPPCRPAGCVQSSLQGTSCSGPALSWAVGVDGWSCGCSCQRPPEVDLVGDLNGFGLPLEGPYPNSYCGVLCHT